MGSDPVIIPYKVVNIPWMTLYGIIRRLFVCEVYTTINLRISGGTDDCVGTVTEVPLDKTVLCYSSAD